MSQHVSDELLHEFVLGDLDEALAVRIALHLDACPACAARAARSEPLATAFAAVDDPLTPDLTSAVLAELRRPEHRLNPELLVGSGLLAGALLLTALVGQPLAAFGQAGQVLEAARSLARALAIGIDFFPLLVAATWGVVLLFGAGTVLLTQSQMAALPLFSGSRDHHGGEHR